MAANCAGAAGTAAGAVAAVGSALSASKTKTKKKHFVCQKVKLFRASEPLLSVLMWGANHTVRAGGATPPAHPKPPPLRAPRERGLVPSAASSPSAMPDSLRSDPSPLSLGLGLFFPLHSSFFLSSLLNPSLPSLCLPALIRPSLGSLVPFCWLCVPRGFGDAQVGVSLPGTSLCPHPDTFSTPIFPDWAGVLIPFWVMLLCRNLPSSTGHPQPCPLCQSPGVHQDCPYECPSEGFPCVTAQRTLDNVSPISIPQNEGFGPGLSPLIAGLRPCVSSRPQFLWD